MKKILFSLLMIISIISIINVQAETCNPDKITIESISIKEKNDNTEEIEELDEEWTYIEGQIEKTWSKSELELVNKINELPPPYKNIVKTT